MYEITNLHGKDQIERMAPLADPEIPEKSRKVKFAVSVWIRGLMLGSRIEISEKVFRQKTTAFRPEKVKRL